MLNNFRRHVEKHCKRSNPGLKDCYKKLGAMEKFVEEIARPCIAENAKLHGELAKLTGKFCLDAGQSFNGAESKPFREFILGVFSLA